MGGKRTRFRKNANNSFRIANPDIVSPDDDSDELMKDLMLQLDSRDKTVQAESRAVLNEINMNKELDHQAGEKQSTKTRFQARQVSRGHDIWRAPGPNGPQARKTAALAQSYSKDDPAAEARLQQESEEEEKTIKRVCDELDVRIHEVSPLLSRSPYWLNLCQINADGHCLYSAVADQLALLSILPPEKASYITTRNAASMHIWTHASDFLPFLSEETPGAPQTGTVMSPQAFERYCAAIRDTGVWGGEPEILALSRAYDVPIHVVQGGPSPVVVHNPKGAPEEGDVTDKTRKVVRISYHRRMYGLGEVSFALTCSRGCADHGCFSITTPCVQERSL
jgi:OTU domain-containing protein 6